MADAPLPRAFVLGQDVLSSRPAQRAGREQRWPERHRKKQGASCGTGSQAQGSDLALHLGGPAAWTSWCTRTVRTCLLKSVQPRGSTWWPSGSRGQGSWVRTKASRPQIVLRDHRGCKTSTRGVSGQENLGCIRGEPTKHCCIWAQGCLAKAPQLPRGPGAASQVSDFLPRSVPLSSCGAANRGRESGEWRSRGQRGRQDRTAIRFHWEGPHHFWARPALRLSMTSVAGAPHGGL